VTGGADWARRVAAERRQAENEKIFEIRIRL
jgi:hypothetical protein